MHKEGEEGSGIIPTQSHDKAWQRINKYDSAIYNSESKGMIAPWDRVNVSCGRAIAE